MSDSGARNDLFEYNAVANSETHDASSYRKDSEKFPDANLFFQKSAV